MQNYQLSYIIILLYVNEHENCLVQCRHTKKNIHIKSCLASIFHRIKFNHYHLYSEIPYNELSYKIHYNKLSYKIHSYMNYNINTPLVK